MNPATGQSQSAEGQLPVNPSPQKGSYRPISVRRRAATGSPSRRRRPGAQWSRHATWPARWLSWPSPAACGRRTVGSRGGGDQERDTHNCREYSDGIVNGWPAQSAHPYQKQHCASGSPTKPEYEYCNFSSHVYKTNFIIRNEESVN